jgi:hypothetical protein
LVGDSASTLLLSNESRQVLLFQYGFLGYEFVIRLLRVSAYLPANIFSVDRKQQVLRSLVESPALGRSEQIRQLLRYIATEEMEGRGGELNEYSIGVQALGRPVGFSPEVDSTVRTRTHELRRRLEEHYRNMPSGFDRLELPKGAYRPVFVRCEPEATVVFAEPRPPEERGRPKFGFWVGVLAGGVACVFLGLLVRLVWPEAEGERAVQKVWGPFLERGSSVTLLLASSPNLWVREFGKDPLPVGDPPFTLPAPDDPRFLDWYRRTVLRDPVRLGLHPNSHAVMGGEASAAVTVAGFLAARGVQLEQFQAESPSAAEIKDRNAIVLGRAEYSGVAAALQPSNGFSVRYIPERREMAIVSADGRQLFGRERSGAVNYGLITVLTKRTNAGPRRTILFAGINSDGSQAAMEYLTSPLDLTELLSEFQGRVPASYQIVIRTRSVNTRPLRVERVAVKSLE